MLNTNILNQMDTDELRNYIYKQDVAMDYYKEVINKYESEVYLLEKLTFARTERFISAERLNASLSVLTDLEYEFKQEHGERPVYEENKND